jgi:hypothetical protein
VLENAEGSTKAAPLQDGEIVKDKKDKEKDKDKDEKDGEGAKKEEKQVEFEFEKEKLLKEFKEETKDG